MTRHKLREDGDDLPSIIFVPACEQPGTLFGDGFPTAVKLIN